jgi:cytochrome c biogenesis protein ResB
MSRDNPFDKQVSYNYPTEAERQRAKPLPTENKQEKDVEKWEQDANAYLREHKLPKRVINTEGSQELYNSVWHNFLIIFFILVLIGGIIFGCWGIYNDKFKTVINDNSTVVCEAPTIPECPTAPSCPVCPSLSCGNVSLACGDYYIDPSNFTGGDNNETD